MRHCTVADITPAALEDKIQVHHIVLIWTMIMPHECHDMHECALVCVFSLWPWQLTVTTTDSFSNLQHDISRQWCLRLIFQKVTIHYSTDLIQNIFFLFTKITSFSKLHFYNCIYVLLHNSYILHNIIFYLLVIFVLHLYWTEFSVNINMIS